MSSLVWLRNRLWCSAPEIGGILPGWARSLRTWTSHPGPISFRQSMRKSEVPSSLTHAIAAEFDEGIALAIVQRIRADAAAVNTLTRRIESPQLAVLGSFEPGLVLPASVEPGLRLRRTIRL